MKTYNEVKDSGKREEWESGSRRDAREGKGRFDLIPPAVMFRVARHYQNGANKYGDHNWEAGMESSRYWDSAMRHLWKAAGGLEDEDHLGAVIWNVMAVMWNEIHRPDLHDLPYMAEGMAPFTPDMFENGSS